MDTTQRKCLSIVWSVSMLRTYPEGTQLTIRTDHNPLKSILNFADTTGRFARFLHRLFEYNFDVVHRGGIKHRTADALSRLHGASEDFEPIKDDLPVKMIDTDTLDPTKIFRSDNQQALAQVVTDNNSLKEGSSPHHRSISTKSGNGPLL